MATKHGFEHKLYRNTGTFGTPTWDLVANCRDMETPMAFSKNEASIRDKRAKMYAAGQFDWGLNWQMVYDPTDTDLTALRTAFFAGTAVDLMDMDGLIATTGTLGTRALCHLFGLGNPKPLDNISVFDVEAAPAYDVTNGGVYYVTGAASPTYTAV